ncbi:outer membrane adhesin like protein [Striga asiatica]|uniref:Outer membrane adhesin like protein n=1 Tax=Striga asiatica TaxID=4170 RepID=A0A5A7RE15_STRAF|nr:outer membrane adhesin like protein [Striga asiatica]
MENVTEENVTEDVLPCQTGPEAIADTENVPLVRREPFLVTENLEDNLFNKLRDEKPVFGHMITIFGEYFGATYGGEFMKKRPITSHELVQADLAINRYEVKPYHTRKCVEAYIERVKVYKKGQAATNAERIDREVLLPSEPQQGTEPQEPNPDQPTMSPKANPNPMRYTNRWSNPTLPLLLNAPDFRLSPPRPPLTRLTRGPG